MSVIDDIKSRLDIVEVIENSGVQLRRAGRSFVGFCPFHQNTKTPAFTVFPDTQSFYCFGCQAAGSVFDYIMRKDGLEFKDALQHLAQRTGVELKPRTQEEQQIDQQRTRLLEITSITARYFAYLLQQHTRGQPGRDYLAQRGINTETIEAFQLGYSLNEWGHLLSYLTERKGFAPEEIAKAGLAVQRDDGGWYDRFRGRLIFPIRNAQGEVVGFGGRAIGDVQPKYLNTPQTLLFDKSRVLYGLDLARAGIRSHDSAVLVEGYVDVLTAYQHGFRNVVAPLGTALTSGHVTLLKKQSHNIYLALDADAAGQRATLKAVHALQQSAPQPDDDDSGAPTSEDMHAVVTEQGLVRWERDVNLHIIRMPPGQDPDEVIKADPQQWRDLVASAVPVVDFYIEAYTADLDLAKTKDQTKALDRIIPLIRQLSGNQQLVYVAKLSRVVGIKEELVLDYVRASQPPTHTRQQPKEEHSPSPSPGSHIDPYLVEHGYRAPQRPPSDEDRLLALLLRYPVTRSVVEETLTHELDAYPLVQELLGSAFERVLERTENRIVWHAWVESGAPPLPAQTHDKPDKLLEWAQEVDESLRVQVEHLAAIVLPRTLEYLYMQDAEKSIRHLRVRQARTWQLRLSQQADALHDADELKHCQALLVELSRYVALLSAPPRSRSFMDVRHTIEGC